MNDYCEQCAGDPRRKENRERHEAHEPKPLEAPLPVTLPGRSETDWLDV